MKNVLCARIPVEYIYLDGLGIGSLYAQVVDSVETSRTMTTHRGVSGKVGAGLRLKNSIVKILSGLEGEASAEMSGSRAHTEQSTSVLTIEHRLNKVIEFLSKSRVDHFFTDLSGASRHLQAADGPVFINIRDVFNAPQFYGRATGTDSVNATGYLLLEKGGTEDYNYSDDYYKQSTAVVKLSASIEKMRTGGTMRSMSHEAVFIRGIQGRHVPLCVFGTISGTFDYIQIKPFAIWK